MLMLSKSLASISFIAAGAVCMSLGNAFGEEVPLWRGMEKSTTQKAADAELIDNVRRLTKGNLEQGALLAIERGWQFVSRGDFDSAIKRFNQAYLLQPELGATYWGLGVASGARGDDPGIWEPLFSKAVEKIQGEGRLYSDWGRIYETNGMPQSAIRKFEQAVKLQPENPESHIGMIRAALALGDEELALKHKEILEGLSK